MRVLPLLLPLLFACAPRAEAQSFVLPVDCSIGDVCVVQNYADMNPAIGVADDPLCGPLSYDGHDGLDIRVPAALAARGVAMLAPAEGVIGAVRDGEEDGAFLRDGVGALNERDCGNGGRIDHAEGWSTQLCHMRSGSLRVAVGDQVGAGQPVGLVGLSGHTEFHHAHITIRRNGDRVEPLTGLPAGDVRCGDNVAPGAIWSEPARTALAYRGAQWFAAGFTGVAPGDNANAETLPTKVTREGEALVFWALAIGPLDGDVLRVRLYGPDGRLVGNGARTQRRDQAQAWLFTGRRTPSNGWAAGQYRGEAQVMRDGRVVATRSESVTLR